MATVNLGLIKFRWQGAYAGGTAYVKDDVVSYNGSSYVCILASTGNLPTDTTYWNVMAQGGTDITSISGLAQGDILYYNGTDWVRLGAGTSGQVLQTGGSGANPSWTNISSDFVKIAHSELSSNATSITMSNVFSTTYDVYHVYFNFRMDTTSQVYMELEKNSDSSFQNANYYFNSNMATRNSSANSVSSQGDWNYGNFRLHENQANSTVNRAFWHFKFIKPMESSTETRWQHHCGVYDSGYSRELVGGGWNGNAEAHKGFKFATTSGNMRDGSGVTVYGLKHA